MTSYRYATKVDRTLYAEDTSKATPPAGGVSTFAPPRTIGATVTCYRQGTQTVIGSFTTGASGWIDATLPEPVADIEPTSGSRMTIYSREWQLVRGRSHRPVAHATPDAVAAELRVPGDWSVNNLTRVHWTGTAWEAV